MVTGALVMTGLIVSGIQACLVPRQYRVNVQQGTEILQVTGQNAANLLQATANQAIAQINQAVQEAVQAEVALIAGAINNGVHGDGGNGNQEIQGDNGHDGGYDDGDNQIVFNNILQVFENLLGTAYQATKNRAIVMSEAILGPNNAHNNDILQQVRLLIHQHPDTRGIARAPLDDFQFPLEERELVENYQLGVKIGHSIDINYMTRICAIVASTPGFVRANEDPEAGLYLNNPEEVANQLADMKERAEYNEAKIESQGSEESSQLEIIETLTPAEPVVQYEMVTFNFSSSKLGEKTAKVRLDASHCVNIVIPGEEIISLDMVQNSDGGFTIQDISGAFGTDFCPDAILA